MSRSIHETKSAVLKIIKKYGKHGPFPESALKIIQRYGLKRKIKKEVLKSRKTEK